MVVALHVTYVRPRCRRDELVSDAPATIGGDVEHPALVDRGRDGLAHGAIAELGLVGPHVEEQRGVVRTREAGEGDVLVRPRALPARGRPSADTIDLTARERRQRLRCARV